MFIFLCMYYSDCFVDHKIKVVKCYFNLFVCHRCCYIDRDLHRYYQPLNCEALHCMLKLPINLPNAGSLSVGSVYRIILTTVVLDIYLLLPCCIECRVV